MLDWIKGYEYALNIEAKFAKLQTVALPDIWDHNNAFNSVSDLYWILDREMFQKTTSKSQCVYNDVILSCVLCTITSFHNYTKYITVVVCV